MSMDLIAGIVILTAVFLIVAGFVGVRLSRPGVDGRLGLEDPQRSRIVFAILLLVFFVGLTDVFVITQQYNLAFTNLTVGIVLAAIQYYAGTPREKAQTSTPVPRVDSAEPVGRER